MDWVLSKLDPQIGVTLKGSLRLNHLAFADDVSLLLETKVGAVWLAKQIEEGLSKVGLLPPLYGDPVRILPKSLAPEN